jgi:RNA polymerase sigma factor (sigma-70 family)
MSENAQVVLLDYLVKRYATLKASLTRVLGGNADLAGDVLHDAWVRLNAKDDYGQVDNPGAYLRRMTVNIAVDVHRRDSKLLSGDEANLLLDSMMDDTPGPEQSAEARSELAILQKIMDKMPPRRQKIAFLVHCEGMEQRLVAKRLKISERTLAYELKHIQEAAQQALGRTKK